MSNHDIPCEICGEDTRGLGAHEERNHSKNDVLQKIEQVDRLPDSQYRTNKLETLKRLLGRFK
jgi:ribosome-binding protein aMBF1 (putative translation factor)